TRPESEQPDRRDRAARRALARADVPGGDRPTDHACHADRWPTAPGADPSRRADGSSWPRPWSWFDDGHPPTRSDPHARCGAPALAAVDGSPATDWQPAKVHATLTARLAPLTGRIRTITVRWGRMWPPA